MNSKQSVARVFNVLLLISVGIVAIHYIPVFIMVAIGAWQLGSWTTPIIKRMDQKTDQLFKNDVTKDDEIK
jgi:hypothetical protein